MHDIRDSAKPLAGFMAIGVAWAAFFAQMPVIKAGVGASDAAYGLAVLWAALGAVAALWLAPLAQRLGGRWAVSFCTMMLAAALLGAGLVPTLWGLALMLLLLSAGSGVIDILVNAQVVDAEARSGRALMNLNHGLYSFAYAGAALSVGVLREAGWLPWQVFALMVLLFSVLALFAVQSPVPLEDTALQAPGGLPTKLVLLAGALVFFAFLVEAVTEGWSALHIERSLAGSAQQGALGPALLGLMMGVGRLSGHALAQFVSEARLMMLACVVTALGLAGAALAPTVLWALVSFALGGLGVSVLAPLALALVGRAVAPHLRLAVIGRVSVLGYGAFFAGPPMMGMIAQGYSLSVAFMSFAVMIGVVAVTLVPWLARESAG
jgi:MFS family permease